MKKFFSFLPALVNIGFGATIILSYYFNKSFFTYHYSAKYFFYFLAVSFFFIGIINFGAKKFYVLNVNFAIMAVLWLIVEFGYKKVLSTEKYPTESLFNKPCSAFDPIRGYRWNPSSDFRCVRYGNGIVIFDQIFHVNNQGYISKYDYDFRKKDSSVFRWIVFGDSFTAGEYIETPWCDKMNQLSAKNGLKTEFFSFGIDGGGIENWHSIFFNEVLPNYEFDGVIVAAFYENFRRDFIANITLDSIIYFGYFKSAPAKDIKPTLDKNWADENNFSTGWKILPDSSINERLKSISVKQSDNIPFYFAALNKLFQKLLSMNYKRKMQVNKNEAGNIEASVKKIYPEEKLKKMGELFSAIKQNKKRVILATIPSKGGATDSPANTEHKLNRQQQEFKYFAEKYGLDFFDSYPEFQKINPDSIDYFWLKHDWHWNQKGSDYFANSFYNYLQKNNP